MQKYYVSRIVRTEGADLRYIWDDGYEQTAPSTWTGFFRAVQAGTNATGEFERYDGTAVFNSGDLVVDAFVENGGVVEDYVAPEPVDGP